MIFLKSLTFILFNVFIGFLIVFIIKMFLFFPKRPIYISGKRIPGSPGFLFRKKEWLIKRLKKLLYEYLKDTVSESEETKIARWEQKAYRDTWDKLEFLDNIRFLPQNIREKIRHFISLIVFEIIKQFLRSFVPFLMKKYQVEKYIEILDNKLDMNLILEYFNKYIYKYMLIISLSLYFLIGLGNMIFYLIIR